jgi:hypothetical protein
MNLKEKCDDFLDLSEEPKRFLIGFAGQKRSGHSRRGKPAKKEKKVE